jgi:hypothetical protein
MTNRKAYQKAYWATYYAKHRAATITRVLAYYKANPEKKRASNARYHVKRKERDKNH